MAESRRYVIVSPCRNEQAYLRRAVASVAAQTHRPVLWVIVDDGSTDQTPAILSEYADQLDFLRVVKRQDRGRRNVGPGVVEAFDTGRGAIDLDHDYLCKLDLDVDLPPAYFETLIQRMEAEPRLGTCSGKPYVERSNGQIVPEGSCGDEMSAGMTKFYRRRCFEQIGGFVHEVMWDGIDCHRSRMLGWTARSEDDPALRFIHLRPMGSSQQGIMVGRMRHGYGQYFMGTGMLYMMASAMFRVPQWPFLVGGWMMFWGYFKSWAKRNRRYEDLAFRTFLRRYQRRCLLVGKARATREIESAMADQWSGPDG